MPKDDWLKLAILYDKTSRYSPSNDSAIDNFCESAVCHNIYPTIISKSDLDTLIDYDGLFIRDTTHPSHYTYEFALYAEMLGKKVIDNPESIRHGCNKIWQVSMFDMHKIPHPKTWLIDRNDLMFKGVTYPCVVKLPDSCFSQGVYLARDRVELGHLVTKLPNIKLVCQEFIETTFDWRIAIFNHQFLFAIKYYMVDKDWKIIKYDRKGDYVEGKRECVAFDDIPHPVRIAAAKCDKFLNAGLYGIDIKEKNNNAYVIEINDNPSIDAGIEDQIEGKKIYDVITHSYRL